jgi:hypothetical protein
VEIRGDLLFYGKGNNSGPEWLCGKSISIYRTLVILFYNREAKSVQPKIIATINKDPARLPMNVTAQ